jgi:molecular chaperone DnaK
MAQVGGPIDDDITNVAPPPAMPTPAAAPPPVREGSREMLADQPPTSSGVMELGGGGDTGGSVLTEDSAEVIVNRPEEVTGEILLPPAGSSQQAPRVVSSGGAGGAMVSGEIKSAPSADPSASTTVLLRTPRAIDRHVVAMDFGTTRSSVAMLVDDEVSVMRLPQVAVIKLPGGGWDMPSVVSFRRDGEVLVGQAAREVLAVDPSSTVASPKRLLGRQYDDPEIQGFVAGLAVPSLPGPGGEVMLRLHDQETSVIQVCAHVLTLLKLTAERNLNHEVRDVVLCVPASYSGSQRDALKKAATLADLRVASLIDEPVAAAVANRFDEHFRGKVAVYDFGGGTFDFAVVEVLRGGLRVLAKGGDPWLGGDDIDATLANAAADAFWRETRIELRNRAAEWQRLLLAAEQAKRELSMQASAVVRLPAVAQTARGQHDLEFPITRAEFADLCRDTIDRSLDTCERVLEQANLRLTELSAVFVSGGTTLIPAVQQGIVEVFEKVPRCAVPPERAVLVGSALHHAIPIGL